jgi:hypothetical protein
MNLVGRGQVFHSSPLKSPTATEKGWEPVPKFRAAWKLPSPLPSSTETLLDSWLAMAQVCDPIAIEVAHRHGVRLGTCGSRIPRRQAAIGSWTRSWQ